jgi:hypothetical protein
VRSDLVRQDLDHDVPPLCLIQDVHDLLVHDITSAYFPAEDCLVQDGAQVCRFLMSQDRLAGHARLDSAFDLLFCRGVRLGAHQRFRISLGLEEPRNHLTLVGAQFGGLRFESDVGLESHGENVAELLPPSTSP